MNASPHELQHVLVGTAGHVDHGKTRLVARLTGIDTDRLPEEKSRGISIDLGFAHWTAGGFRFGVVDVPGHERFVRTMVAGATGVDIAMLVVAADDGVMPQTREHLDVMDLLGLDTGLVVITKADLVDDETIELVRMEIEELVAGTFLEAAPVAVVSTETDSGIEALETSLVETATRRSPRLAHDTLRLPIDRAFTLTGHGTIVTGSPRHGSVRAGETLELLPAGREVRVRSVENHGEELGDAGNGRRRTAVNLAGVSLEDVARGMELATPGTLEPSRRLVVRLRALASHSSAISNRSEVRLHIGTADVACRVILPEGPLAGGDAAYAELRTAEPVVAAFGERFILRRPSPAMTIAGGEVLDPAVPDRHRLRGLVDHAASLHGAAPVERLAIHLATADVVPPVPRLATKIGATLDETTQLLDSLRDEGDLVDVDGRHEVHRRRLEAVRGSVLRVLRDELERHHPRRTLPGESIRKLCGEIAPGPVVAASINAAVAAGELVEVGGNLGPAELVVPLTKRQRAALAVAIAAIHAAGDTPPPLRELSETAGLEPSALAEVLNTEVDDGRLIRVSEQLWFPPAVLDRYRGRCVDMLTTVGSATLSQLRECWGVTRKWAVPVAEHLDQCGVMIRDGDVRRLPTTQRTRT